MDGNVVEVVSIPVQPFQIGFHIDRTGNVVAGKWIGLVNDVVDGIGISHAAALVLPLLDAAAVSVKNVPVFAEGSRSAVQKIAALVVQHGIGDDVPLIHGYLPRSIAIP